MHTGHHLYYKISTDRGQTWSSETRAAGGNYQVKPTLLQDSSSRLWLLWVSKTQDWPVNIEHIQYTTSMDYGRTWANLLNIITTPLTSKRPNIVEIDGEVCILWGPDGYWSTTRNAGATWSHKWLYQVGFNPTVYRAHDGHMWMVVWTGSDISASKGMDISKWSVPIKITNDKSAIADEVFPEVGQDQYGNFVVVWNSQHHDPNNSDIWYSTSSDNGLSWQPPQRLTQDSGQDKNPCVVLIDGSLWVIWDSDRAGYKQIYAFELGPSPCDINVDGYVDLADYSIFSQHWKLVCEAGEVCTTVDFDKNGRIDATDLAILTDHWLRKTPWTLPEP